MQHTTPGFLCPSITLTTAFRNPCRPTNLQGTAVILKIYDHPLSLQLPFIMPTQPRTADKTKPVKAACRNWTILTDRLIVPACRKTLRTIHETVIEDSKIHRSLIFGQGTSRTTCYLGKENCAQEISKSLNTQQVIK